MQGSQVRRRVRPRIQLRRFVGGLAKVPTLEPLLHYYYVMLVHYYELSHTLYPSTMPKGQLPAKTNSIRHATPANQTFPNQLTLHSRSATQRIHSILQAHPELILWPPVLPVRLLPLNPLHGRELHLRSPNPNHRGT